MTVSRFLLAVSCAASLLPRAAAAQEAALLVEPPQAELVGNLARVQLSTTTVQGGRDVDVTRTAKFESLTPDLLTVSPRGLIAPKADGVGRVRVSAGEKSVEVAVTVKGVTPIPAVSFREDVIPILTRSGCNGGACHGAQFGQGGFLLSLFGFAPEKDHPSLVRDLSQRRISLVSPEDSLILRKATMQVGHGGGKRFEVDSYEATVLRDWITTGVGGLKKDEPEVVDLTVTPAQQTYRVDDHRQLRVVATYSDGTTQDVTNRARYDSLGDGVARVDDSGYVSVVGKGQAAIMVRYQFQAKVSHVLSPYADNVDLAAFVPNNFVDEKVKARWQQLGIVPSPLCSDAEFLRRAYLDSIGTLPTKERVEAFAASTDANKRAAVVDELLGVTGDPKRDVFVNEWSAYWALKWGDLLRNNRNKVGDGGMWSLSNWIRQSFRENMPMDRFVAEIIAAQGSIQNNGPANYYSIATSADDLAETTAQVFLGVRLQCAKCHNHPFEAYSQKDYYSLAAFFTRVGTKGSPDFGALGSDTVVLVKSTGSISHPRTGQVMEPTPLKAKPADVKGVRDLRRPLAAWLVAKDNPYFARNVVNRTWSYFLGTGIVESVDDMRATNPASNPDLLDALAADFVANGFDLRKLMRAIMTSRVYQLSSAPRPENVADTRFYPHYNVKRLPAEVLLDAIDYATLTREKFAGVPEGTRAIELPDPNYASYFLDTLGRPKRVIACECERTADPNLAQVLQVANGELLQRKLTDKAGRLTTLSEDKVAVDDAIRELYLVTLSRPAVDAEIQSCRTIIEKAPNRREGLEDVLWSLVNSREFLFNH